MKRSRIFISFAAGAIVTCGLGLGGIFAGGTNGGGMIAAALADPLAMLALRSPGAREPGAMFQTKQAKAPSVFAVLPEKAPASQAAPAGNGVPMGDGDLEDPAPQGGLGPTAFAVLPSPNPQSAPGLALPPPNPYYGSPVGLNRPRDGSSGGPGASSGGETSSGDPGTSSGGGTSSGNPGTSSGGGTSSGDPGTSSGGGTSSGDPGTSSGDPLSSSSGSGGSSGGPPPVSAVPEPETWALMIVGMFGIGAAMRRNRRRNAQRSAPPLQKSPNAS
ncbi:MAG: PEPxxWA-CTERM sorting domain-containing protein [Sphingobium sp.]